MPSDVASARGADPGLAARVHPGGAELHHPGGEAASAAVAGDLPDAGAVTAGGGQARLAAYARLSRAIVAGMRAVQADIERAGADADWQTY